MFDKLQSVGKALMLPVAVLPAAAILLRFGANDLLGDTNNNGPAGLAGFICHTVLTASLKSLNHPRRN